MTRSPRAQHGDDDILDRAAALFARRGFAKTSVQEIADAVGLSKAGLLHHYPTKDALHAAVTAQAGTLADQVVDARDRFPGGGDQDRATVEVLVDIAFAHPGLVALLLSPSADDPAPECAASAGTTALRAFGLEPDTAPEDPTRTVRVLGALAALAVLVLAATEADAVTAWRPLIVATCLDALGSRHPAADPDRSTDPEA